MTARSFGNQRKDVGRFIDGVAESNAEAGSRVDYEHEHRCAEHEHEHEHEHRCAEHEHDSQNESQN
jgi:hypothetical protein